MGAAPSHGTTMGYVSGPFRTEEQGDSDVVAVVRLGTREVPSSHAGRVCYQQRSPRGPRGGAKGFESIRETDRPAFADDRFDVVRGYGIARFARARIPVDGGRGLYDPANRWQQRLQLHRRKCGFLRRMQEGLGAFARGRIGAEFFDAILAEAEVQVFADVGALPQISAASGVSSRTATQTRPNAPPSVLRWCGEP